MAILFVKRRCFMGRTGSSKSDTIPRRKQSSHVTVLFEAAEQSLEDLHTARKQNFIVNALCSPSG